MSFCDISSLTGGGKRDQTPRSCMARYQKRRAAGSLIYPVAVDLYPGDIDKYILPGYIITGGVTSMNATSPRSCTAFRGHRLLASGPLEEVALAVKNASEGLTSPIFIYDDANGCVIDL